MQKPAAAIASMGWDGTAEIRGNQGSEFGQAGTVPGKGSAMAAATACLA